MPQISYVPGAPYSTEELRKLYPYGLYLEQVQILARHGERTPSRPLFQNIGLPKYWPGCSASEFFSTAVGQITGGAVPQTFEWSSMSQIRKLETFGPSGEPILAASPKGSSGGLCGYSELTDIGRQSTFRLGKHLRTLYVDQLGFMPKIIDNHDMMYLRTTPLSRTLATLQQTVSGMYSPAERVRGLGPFPIMSRTFKDEMHYPINHHCPRYAELFRDFIKVTCQKYNGGPELDHVSSKIGKYLHPSANGKVRVDGKPTIAGILDYIHSSLGAGDHAKLPAEFYDPTSIRILQNISNEAVFQGYEDSLELRTLGAGPVMFDVLARMMSSVGHSRDSPNAVTTEKTKFAVVATHDVTLGMMLYALGAKQSVTEWPPYTSHIAIELFKAKDGVESAESDVPSARNLAIKKSEMLTKAERKSLDGYYVRLKYNDKLVLIPACAAEGNHRPGDESLCTLKVFKETVDAFRPVDHQAQCHANVGQGIIDA